MGLGVALALREGLGFRRVQAGLGVVVARGVAGCWQVGSPVDAAQTGEPVKVRLTAPVLMNRVKKLRDSLDGAAVLRRVRALHGELEAPKRQAIAGEIDKLREVLSAISRELRAR